METATGKKSQLHLPNKCALNLALHACEMFQIQNLLVELGLCLNKNRVQTVLIPRGQSIASVKKKTPCEIKPTQFE